MSRKTNFSKNRHKTKSRVQNINKLNWTAGMLICPLQNLAVNARNSWRPNMS
jgi:hypothetical protein